MASSMNLMNVIIGLVIVGMIGFTIMVVYGLGGSEGLSNLAGNLAGVMMGGRRSRHFGMMGLAAILVIVIIASMVGLSGSLEGFTTTDASGNNNVTGNVNVAGDVDVSGQVGISGTTSLAGDIVHVGDGVFLGGGALAPGATYKAGIVSKGTAWTDGAVQSLKGQAPGTYMIAGPSLWKSGSTYYDNQFYIYWNGLDGNQYGAMMTGAPIGK